MVHFSLLVPNQLWETGVMSSSNYSIIFNKINLFLLKLIYSINISRKWLPCCKVLKLIAVKEEREEIIKNHLKPGKFDVCLTSYEGVNICKSSLLKFKWKYVIIDEAHRIKNEVSLLSTVIFLYILVKCVYI